VDSAVVSAVASAVVSAVVSAVASAEALAQLEELEVVPVNTGELRKMIDDFLSILCIKLV